MKIGINVPVSLDAGESVVFESNHLWISGRPGECTALSLPDGRRVFLFGEVFYHVKTEAEATLLTVKDTAPLLKIFETQRLEDVVRSLEGVYAGVQVETGGDEAVIFQDAHGRLDVFYALKDRTALFSDSVDPVAAFAKHVAIDPMPMTFFLLLNYTPKKHTLYRGIRRLGIQETVRYRNGAVSFETFPLRPIRIEKYSDADLEKYWSLIQTAVFSRATGGDTWLSFSGGWDSTFLLALLVSRFGPAAVRTQISVMRYSKKGGAYNPYEIERTQKIADLMGVQHHTVENRLADDAMVDFIASVRDHLKSKHLYYVASPGAFKISELIRSRSTAAHPVLFNGDMSDTIHNFGFSQLTSILHSVESFSEYADKMACYLYGPHFFEKVLRGEHTGDFVYQMFRERHRNVRFRDTGASPAELKLNYILPFIFGSPRMPFVDVFQQPFVRDQGREAFYDWMTKEYLGTLLENIDPACFYYWLLHCYRNFHFQGYNGKQYAIGAEAYGIRSRQPFLDLRLVDFCSAMPENWGRGLEFRRVKYPMKWCLEEKLKFPTHVLSSGPHSYIFEVDRNALSPTGQALYESALSPRFRELLKSRGYRRLLDESCFDLQWIDGLVDRYVAGESVGSAEGFLRNLISLDFFGVF